MFLDFLFVWTGFSVTRDAGSLFGTALSRTVLRGCFFALSGAFATDAGVDVVGFVAATLGAQVVQTDGHAVALHLCRRNGQRNHARAIEYRQADWASWNDETRYEWIVGADILYGESLHPHLREIFEHNLAPGGRVLLADPFREIGLKLLEGLEKSGWSVRLSKWSVGEDAALRAIGIYELAPPP